MKQDRVREALRALLEFVVPQVGAGFSCEACSYHPWAETRHDVARMKHGSECPVPNAVAALEAVHV